MVSKYSVDVVGALLQVAHGPRLSVAGPEPRAESRARAAAALAWCTAHLPVDVLLSTLMVFLRACAPRWVRGPVGALLTQWLLRDGAVFLLVNGMVRSGTEDGRADAVARAAQRVATVPPHMAPAVYYGAVCPQVARLVQQVSCRADDATVYCGLVAARLVAEHAPDLAQRFLVQPTLDAFAAHRLGERALEVHTVYVARLAACRDTAELYAPALAPLFPVLFDLCVRAARSVSPLRQPAREAAGAVLAHAADTLRCVRTVLARAPGTAPYRFAHGPTGGLVMVPSVQGLQVKKEDGNDEDMLVEDDDTLAAEPDYDLEAQTLLGLLQQVDTEDVVGTLFLDLLKLLCDSGSDSDSESDSDGATTTTAAATAATAAAEGEGKGEYTNKRLCLALLSLFPGAFGPEQLLRNVVQLTDFLATLLGSRDAVNASLAVLLLHGLLSGAVAVRAEHAFLFRALLPALEHVAGAPPTTADPQLVSMTRTVIDMLASDSPTWTTDTAAARAEVATAAASAASATTGETETTTAGGDAPPRMSPLLFQLGQELRAPTLAERGGALVTLRKLVLERSAAVAAAVPDVLALFVDAIRQPDEEAFVCGTAISGLACLGDVYPAAVVPVLQRLYADAALAEPVRARVGEALLETLRLQGDMVVRYVDSTMAVLLRCVAADSPAGVRASALSIIAALVRACPAACFTACRDELAYALRRVLATDADALVRRGCTLAYVALALSLLSTPDALTAHGARLVRMRAFLQTVARTDSDDIVRANAAAAADAITEEIPLVPDDVDISSDGDGDGDDDGGD